MLVFAPYARFIPRAALAGILMVSAWNMVDWRSLLYHLRTTRFDAAIVAATAFAAVAISIEFCVLIGVLMSFLLTVPRAGRMLLTEFVLTPAAAARAPARRRAVSADPRLRPRGRDVLRRDGRARGALREHRGAHRARHARGGAAREARAQPRRRRPRRCSAASSTASRRAASRCSCAAFARSSRTSSIARGSTARLGEKLFLEQPVRQTSTLLAIRHAYERIGNETCAICPRRVGAREPIAYEI